MTIKLKNMRLVLITAIISIITFSTVVYYSYTYIRYLECMNNNAVLISYSEGNEELINTDTGVKTYGGQTTRIACKGNEIIVVVDDNLGYIKMYDKNILKEIHVENRLADLKSYFNPLVWFGGSRNIQGHHVYILRSVNEIEEIRNKIDNDGADYVMKSGIEYEIINGDYIIIK